MAVLALGALGAGIGSAIGGTFLGMSAASLGWSLGSMAGNMLFGPKQPDQFGPRLGDLKIQASTYGNSIPVVYGTMRLAGNVIWSTNIVETSHTQSSGGKGGGGATQTNYTYSQSFAVAVCEGTIAGVRKIWANGKLIYNLSDTADIATIVASNKSAAGLRVYTGSETQTADSLIQANIGAADTPAYRGTAYVVFENLQLADYGNRTPNLEFEVVLNGGTVLLGYTYARVLINNAVWDGASPYPTYVNGVATATYISSQLTLQKVTTGRIVEWSGTGTAMTPSRTTTAIRPYNQTNGSHVPNSGLDLSSLLSSAQIQTLIASGAYSDDTPIAYPYALQLGGYGYSITDGTAQLGVLDGGLNEFIYTQISEWNNFSTIQYATKTALEAGTPVVIANVSGSVAYASSGAAQSQITANLNALLAAHPTGVINGNTFTYDTVIGTLLSGDGNVALPVMTGIGGNFATYSLTKNFSGGWDVKRRIARSYSIRAGAGVLPSSTIPGTVTLSWWNQTYTNLFGTTSWTPNVTGVGGTIALADTNLLSMLPATLPNPGFSVPWYGETLTWDNPTVSEPTPGNLKVTYRFWGTGVYGGIPGASFVDVLTTGITNSTVTPYYIDYTDTASLVTSYNSGLSSSATLTAAQHNLQWGVWDFLQIPADKTKFVSAYGQISVPYYGLQVGGVMLSTIVSNICARAGMIAGQIDVTALTDTVDGYVVQRGTARSQIEQLMQAFYFDAVESDGKIKFVKRGGALVAVIPEDDLAAHSYGGTMPDNLVIMRKQEMELPLEFDVQFMDKAANYMVGSQRSSRLTTSSQNKTSVNLAISMSASKAKQICDVLMYDAWTSRTTFNFTTGWKYSYLEPTDVIAVTKGTNTYFARITGDDLNVGISSRQAALEDSTVYTQTAVAAEQPSPINTVSLAPGTDLLLLDIPLLRDQDDAVGFYAAACGYGAGWKGAQAYKSNDGGASWNSYGDAFLHAASIGTAAGALGTFSSGNIFDETNTVSVVLINGTLSSDTELNVLNGANVALLGNEIIQFKNATLTATSTYTLSGLLRGRQGTEWAMTTHAVGDRFVLLSSTTTYLFPASSAEYNLARKYRGVSFSTFLSDAANVNFTNTAAAQKPLSPVQIGAGRNAALDITLNWTRRTRIGGGWSNYSDAPLGEAAESYSIDIMQGATVKRTLTSFTPTVQYTSAQQVTDFGSNQSAVLVNVYQISATVGRGFVGIATV